MAERTTTSLNSERYRQTRCAPLRSEKELAYRATHIADPVQKLRFLRRAIDGDRPASTNVQLCVAPSRLIGTIRGVGLVGACCLAILLTAYGLGTPTAPLNASSRVRPKTLEPTLLALDSETMKTGATIVAAPVKNETTSPSLPVPTIEGLGITPAAIWLADRGTDWELYSNGLRIETRYAVSGDARRFRIHERKAGLQPTVYSAPVGILFHTSESDLWPLHSDFEKQLRKSSTALLNYVKEQRAYNYLIDRFGRVYRVVNDDTRANHAGHSVWANGKDVYLDLNSAFIGVSFESRWEGGESLPITRAQLIAGRNLTHFLRQRYSIAPEMCTTHGLTSVSPKQHLLGYHKDWARGFPFAAFDLPDQYAKPAPSVELFGFNYDDDLVRAVGDGWPGAFAAETALIKEAFARGITIDVLRAERRALYLQWVRDVRNTQQSNDLARTTSTSGQRG
jgi:hypothetical protein